MPRESHFWRNVTLVAFAHLALLLGLIRWSVEARSSSDTQSIVWISGAQDLTAGEPNSSESPQPAMTPIPPPETEPLEKDEAAEESPLVTAANSEIELPAPTPTPTSTPKPTATPTPKPKATPKQTPTPAVKPAKKKAVAKASPKPSPKAKPSPAKSAEKTKKADAKVEKKKPAPAKEASSSQTDAGKTGSATKVGHNGGGTSESEFGWYGNMLHDRFYSAWIQPTTTGATGTKISTLVKVRIEKDGRVSKFDIVKPSENVVVNESVAMVAKRVTHVDPPPAGLGNGDHYDVKINFELNTDQGAGSR